MKLKEKFLKFTQLLAQAMFPEKYSCIFCGKEIFDNNKYSICKTCSKTLPFINNKICLKCGNEISDMGNFCLRCKSNVSSSYNRAFAPFKFEGKIVQAIHNLKYHNKKYLGKYLSEFILDYFQKQNLNIDIVIPIPLNEKRYNERGYNQSELLCEAFKERHFYIDTTNLIRAKYTKTQTDLSMKERKENLHNAFKILNKKLYMNKNILLIDDVFTTGAIMEEAARVIKSCKAKTIYCLTLAHVSLNKDN